MRARNLKPGTFKNELLAVADPLHTLIFAGLWCLADREGRLEDRPAKIHFDINPGRAFETTEKSLAWLAENGFIARYESGGIRCIWVKEFKKHQNPHQKEPPSKLPEYKDSTVQAPVLPEAKPVLVPEKTQCGPADSLFLDSPSLIPDSGYLIPDSCSSGTNVEQKLDGSVERVFDHWRRVMEHPRAQLDPKRRKVIRGALKAYPEADLCEAISGYLNSPHHMGENDRNTRYTAIELLLRDAAHVDAGLQFARAPPIAHSSVTDHNVRALTEWLHADSRQTGIRDANGAARGDVLEKNNPAAHRALLASAREPEH